VLDTVASKGQLQTHSVEIQNSELFGTLANMTKNESWRKPSLTNLNIKFEIKDGQVIVEPILMNILQNKLELSGGQGLDMTLNYKVNATVPVSAIGSGATDLLSKIPGGSNVREIKIAGLIGGKATSPNVSLDVADMAGSVVSSVTQAVKEQVKEQVMEEVDKQKAAVMAEAEKQAENVRNTARQTANRIRAEANAAADKLESEARNPIQKIAAKTAADALRKEGETNAVKVEQEAERQIAAIMDAARKQAQ
jgi:hypothetical protein